jgi:hypothetical protein
MDMLVLGDHVIDRVAVPAAAAPTGAEVLPT